MKKYKETFIADIERSDIDWEPPFYEPGAGDSNDFEYMNRAVLSEAPPIPIRS